MSLDSGAERIAQSKLEAGENLLWVGQPDPKRYALKGLPLALFGLPFVAVAVFIFVKGLIMGEPMRSDEGGDASLLGIPFLVVGFGLMSSPLWYFHEGSQTVYAVTDKRLLIIKGGGSPSVQSFDKSSIGLICFTDTGKIECVERSNGSGDILFAEQVSKWEDSDGSLRTGIESIGFFGIPDVRSVEELVRDVARPNAR